MADELPLGAPSDALPETAPEPRKRARRRIADTSEITPPATVDAEPLSAMEAVPVTLAKVKLPLLRDRNIHWNFIAALVVGALFALAGIINHPITNSLGLVGPIAVVVGFYVLGLRSKWANHGDTQQRFADACYFLGFLFTMWALLVGFVPAGLGWHKLSSTEILRHFGMALGATAAGLICRILVLQSGSYSDDAASVEADLHAYAAQITAEAAAIVTELATVREQMVSMQKEGVDRAGAAFEAGLAAAAARFTSAAAQIESTFSQSAAEAEQAAATFNTRIEREGLAAATAAAATVKAQTALTETATDVGREMADFREALHESRVALTGAMGAAAGQMQALSSSLSSRDLEARGITEAIGGIDSRLKAAAAGIDVLGAAAESSEALLVTHQAEAAGVKSAVDQELAQTRTEVQALIAKGRAEFHDEIAAATQELASIINDFTAQLAALRETTAA